MTRSTSSTLSKLDRPAMRVRVDGQNKLVIDEVNDPFLEMSGFDRYELDDKPLKELEARDGQLPAEKIASAICNNLGGRYVFRARRPGDISYELCLTVVPQARANGANEGALIYAADYTHWKLWRPEREDELTGTRDRYFLRLYLSRMVRRANRIDQSVGIVEVDVLDHDFLNDSSRRRSITRWLIKKLQKEIHEDDVIACRNESTVVIVRPDHEAVDRDFDRFAIAIDFRLSRPDFDDGLEDLPRVDVTWSSYPETNTPFRMLGYEPSFVA